MFTLPLGKLFCTYLQHDPYFRVLHRIMMDLGKLGLVLVLIVRHMEVRQLHNTSRVGDFKEEIL